MYYRSPYRSMLGGASAAIILLGMVLAFAFGGFNLVIFFTAIGIAILVSSFNVSNPKGPLGGLIGAMWMFMLALFFATNSWLWFLVGAALSALIGSFNVPLTALLIGVGASLFGRTAQPKQPAYEAPPVQQPSQPQPYRDGYQAPQTEGYYEGGQQHAYPTQQAQENTYEQPQTPYQPEMPPQQ